jgi:Ni,Fe-hydrogenase III component G
MGMVSDVLAELASPDLWQQRPDGRWIEVPALDVRTMASALLRHEARLVTLTAAPAAGSGYRLIYHWDVEDELVNVVTHVEREVASIADIAPAADWVERELRDYYALEFTGRQQTDALMLRPGDEPGLFSRTRDLGRGGDPADDARRSAGESAAEDRL